MRVHIFNMRCSENGTPGKNWKMKRTGGWMKTYRMVEEKPHEVIIHWGNGRTDKYDSAFLYADLPTYKPYRLHTLYQRRALLILLCPHFT